MAKVFLEHVDKVYPGNVKAVDDFNLEIRDGEFVVLVGPSGCGKSTLLRMVAGLEEISAGTIRIGDRVVNDVPPKDRDIAMVFQNYALYPHMTVRENMAFGLKLRKFPKKEIEARVQEAAAILGLGELLERRPKALSGGQRQRVAVGRAIVRKPAVFLFDEPLSNLDAKMRVEMRSEINRLHRRLGATMVYVTHDQVEAMTMGDRIVVMERGTIQQAAPPLAVYQRPANLFVAGFIGTPPMNFLKGRIVLDQGACHFKHALGRIVVPERCACSVGPFLEREVVLGFRPEAVGAEHDETAGCAIIQGTVDVVEPMGAETFVQIVLEDGTRVVARVSPERLFLPGAIVALPVSLEHALFFDAVTGNAIGGALLTGEES